MSVPVRVGLGYDVHPFDQDRPLVLAGVRIAGPGLAGHSDADAVAHAVADALLGAAGLGDLGSRYPADDARWAGADSMRLLADVSASVADAGWIVGNIDVVIAAEQPRLAPYVAEMQERIAQACATGDERPHVSVGPKRGEGIGAVGRGEGIAVWAVALLARADR